jgi:hypothetical protein
VTPFEDGLRTLRSALRALEDKQRRTRGEGYRMQIKALKEMINYREIAHVRPATSPVKNDLEP